MRFTVNLASLKFAIVTGGTYGLYAASDPSPI